MELRITVSLVLAVTGAWAPLTAAEENVAELTKELKGEKPAAQRTPAELEAVYVKVLDNLLPDLSSDDMGKRGNGQSTIERIAFQAGRPGAEAERAACAKALAGRLGGDVAAPARVWILRQLERIGRGEVVAQVAVVLDDKDALVSESARRALQKNASPEANAALLKALDSAGSDGRRVALIGALAGRGEPASVPALTKQAASPNDAVRAAAVTALAKVGDKSAAETIAAGMSAGSEDARRAATDAYLRLAEALVAKGDKPAALAMYRKMLPGKGHLRCAGLVGLGRAGGSAELPTLLDALGDEDVAIRGSAIEALVLMPGPAVTAAMVAKGKTASAEMKPALLRALASRGDRTAMPSFLAGAEDADEAVRAEAARGLGMLGDAGSVPVLLKLAGTSGRPQDAARQALQRVGASDVDRALLARVSDKDTAIRAEAIRALAARGVKTAAPALLRAADDPDAAIRAEALKALGAVGATDSLPPVTALLIKAGDDGTRNEAAGALVRIAAREADTVRRSAPIVRALSSAKGPARLALLGVAGRVGGKACLQAVQAAMKDPDPKVQEAAIRALAEWPDAEAADDLLQAAKSAPAETLQVLAIRGYIRVVRIRSDRPAAQTAQMLAAGLAAAKRGDEKKQALSALGEVRDIQALKAVAACMDDDVLREEAAQAAVRIGRDIWDRDLPTVKAAMSKVLEVSKSQDACRRARETLDRVEQRLKEAGRK